jgi:hypothetical protein
VLTPAHTVADVAAVLAIDDDGVRNLIHTGQLAAFDVSKSPRSRRKTWRITEEALQAFISARSTRQPAAPAPRKRKPPAGVIQFFK